MRFALAFAILVTAMVLLTGCLAQSDNFIRVTEYEAAAEGFRLPIGGGGSGCQVMKGGDMAGICVIRSVGACYVRTKACLPGEPTK